MDDPDLTVDELMRRVRQEVERRHWQARMRDASFSLTDDQVSASWQAMNEALVAAEPATAVGSRLPPMTQMHGLRRRLAIPAARIILRVAQLVTREQAAFNKLILDLVRMLTNAVYDRLTSATGKIDTLAEDLGRTASQIRVVPELVEAGVHTAAELRMLRERIRHLEDTAVRFDAALAEAERRTNDALANVRADGAALSRSLEEAQLRAQHLQTQVLLHERRIGMLLQADGARPSDAGSAKVTALAEEARAHRSDAFYVGFEDHFRGTREDVKGRTRVYLQIITDAGAGTAERPVLDIGCGRGEWLELLKENGLVGRGIDLNQAMTLENQARGLEVLEGDALAYLQGLPEASLGAITGIHVLEHLDFPTVVEIFDECLRVLQPGGVAIFETPNPKNLVVGACKFHLDPTHRAPLHPDAMRFVAEARGLTRVHILPLHPVEDGRLSETDSPIAVLLNEYFFGPQDFALIGYRA